MDPDPPPTEWVLGRSRAPYFFAYLLGCLAILVGWSWVVLTFSGDPGPSWTARDFTMFGELQAFGPLAYVAFTILWFGLVPMPLGSVEVSPTGLTIDYGLRRERFPWYRVYVVDSRLYTVSRWLGLANRYSLTRYQESRLRLFVTPRP